MASAVKYIPCLGGNTLNFITRFRTKEEVHAVSINFFFIRSVCGEWNWAKSLAVGSFDSPTNSFLAFSQVEVQAKFILQIKSIVKAIDLFTVFSATDMDKLGKSVDTDWREHLNISQTALFESDTS